MERETEREAEREPTKKESRNRHWGGVYMMKTKKKKKKWEKRAGWKFPSVQNAYAYKI